jgi:peptide/nickel transport system substrate-binding protein
MTRRDSQTARTGGQYTRRRLLQAGVVTGAVGLAGCSGNSNAESDANAASDGTGTGGDGAESSTDASDEESTTAGSGGELLDPALGTKIRTRPDQLQFNPYNPRKSGVSAIWDPLTTYSTSAAEHLPVIVRDWSFDGTTVTLRFDENWSWHDGTPVTAKDLEAQFTLEEHLGYTLATSLASYEATDDYTFTVEQSGTQVNPGLFKPDLLRRDLSVKRDEYRRFLELFEDASTDEARKGAETELTNHKITEPYGNSMWKVADRSRQKIVLERFDDHPWADRQNVRRFEHYYSTGNQNDWQMIRSNTIDHYGSPTPPEVVEAFPDEVRMDLTAHRGGKGLVINHAREPYGRREVRQGLAHVIDRQEVVKAAYGGWAVAMPVPTALHQAGDKGAHPAQFREYVPEEHRSKFNRYRKDDARAAELFERAGLSKRNGTWRLPDGSTWSPAVKVAAGWTDDVAIAESFVAQLKEFGIDAQVQTVESTTWISKTLQNHDFELASFNWEPRVFRFYPPFKLRGMLVNEWDGESTLPAGISNYTKETVTVPSLEDPSTTKTYDLRRLVEDMWFTDSTEAARRAVVEGSWVVNQDLVNVPVLQKMDQEFYTKDHYDLPDKGSEFYGVGLGDRLRFGAVTGKTN